MRQLLHRLLTATLSLSLALTPAAEAAFHTRIDAAGGVNFDTDSPITIGAYRDALINGGHPAGWLGDGESGHMALADSLLGLTPPSDPDPTDGEEPSDWRIDLASYGVEAQLPTGAGYDYLQEVAARPDTTLEPIVLLDYSHYEVHRQLSPAAMKLLAIAVSQFVGPWLANIGLVTNATTPFMAGFLNASVSSVITQTVAGVVSGEFDVGEILEGAVFAGVTAGLTTAINLNFAQGHPFHDSLIANFGSDQLTMAGLLNAGLDGVISSGLSSAVYGTDFRDGVIAGLVSYIAEGLSGAAIEEVSDAFGHYSFDLQKLVAKATITCLAAEAKGADCAAGALGSLVTDFLTHYSMTSGDTLGAVDPDEYRDRLELIAAVAGFFASSGEAGNIDATVAGALTDFDNNCGPCIWIIPAIVIFFTGADYVLTAKDAYDLAQEGLACDAGDRDACNRMAEMAEQYALETGITLTVGQIIPGDKLGMKLIAWMRKHGDEEVVDAVDDAVDAYHGGVDGEAGDPNGFMPGQKSDGSFADGGHLIDRHVGKTDQELTDRANGPNSPRGGASSFENLDAADYYVSSALDARSADIDAYIQSGATRPMEFDLDTGQSTGRWVPNGGTQSQSVTGVRVVIRPNPSSPRGYDVVTGYPVDPSNFTNP